MELSGKCNTNTAWFLSYLGPSLKCLVMCFQRGIHVNVKIVELRHWSYIHGKDVVDYRQNARVERWYWRLNDSGK